MNSAETPDEKAAPDVSGLPLFDWARETTPLMGYAIFSGDFAEPDSTRVLDVDMAYAEILELGPEYQLEGFTVLRLPQHLRMWLYHPLDDFLEIHWVGLDDDDEITDVKAAVEGIAARYGGYADMFGPQEPDHRPFSPLFRAA
jgi:hypothetical protein